MKTEAVFREFPAKNLRKLTVSGRNPSENADNSTQESGDRGRLSVLTGSYQFRAEPDESGHRIRSPEYCFHETSRIPQNRQFPCRIARPGHSRLDEWNTTSYRTWSIRRWYRTMDIRIYHDNSYIKATTSHRCIWKLVSGMEIKIVTKKNWTDPLQYSSKKEVQTSSGSKSR